MIIYHPFISFHIAYIYYHLTMLMFTLFMFRIIVYKELTLTKLQRQYCYFYSNARQISSAYDRHKRSWHHMKMFTLGRKHDFITTSMTCTVQFRIKSRNSLYQKYAISSIVHHIVIINMLDFKNSYGSSSH
jgi:hypothetical protein